jgi:hypothetical protein
MALVRRLAGPGCATVALWLVAVPSCGLDLAGAGEDAGLPPDATTADASVEADAAAAASDASVESDASDADPCVDASACTATLRVRGYIDATSQLVLKGSTLHWYNDSGGAAPGLWQTPPSQPTYLDSVAWTPTWPNTGENRSCNCSSSDAPIAPLAARAQTITQTIVEGRGTVVIAQQPRAANGYTAVLELSDPQGGASWYEVVLGYGTK